MKKCVFAGSFDPPTKGHKKVIDECLALFDEVVVAVMVNTQKTPCLSTGQRVSLLKKLYSGEPRVKVISFSGAAVDLLNAENTPFYVRGVRNTVDFEYENADYFANKALKEDIITIYIPADRESIHVSSTLVKNSVKFKKELFDYVPAEILNDFLKMVKNK